MKVTKIGNIEVDNPLLNTWQVASCPRRMAQFLRLVFDVRCEHVHAWECMNRESEHVRGCYESVVKGTRFAFDLWCEEADVKRADDEVRR